MDLTLANAIIYHDKDTVYSVLEKKEEDINATDEYGYNPLVEAAIFDKIDIAELLLAQGATVDNCDLTGRTPLHWAADNRSLRMTRLLLRHGADANAYTLARQPVLAFPLLRQQEDMKQLLLENGASLDFARDFINTKLIGHRYELVGDAYIVDDKGRYVLMEYEGFFLEFTLAIMHDSLIRFKKNFGARNWRSLHSLLQVFIDAIQRSTELRKYQHYTPRYKQHEPEIDRLLSHQMILIPVAYEGHAISCVNYGSYWVKIDRGWNSRLEGSVVVYRVTRPEWLTRNFFKHLLYKKHSREYVNEGLNQQIGLVKIGELPLPAQQIGNCSWANVEGAIAAMMFLVNLDFSEKLPRNFAKASDLALNFFEEWREWDKDRALEECIEDFHHANPARKNTKVTLLATVLAQTCDYRRQRDLERAEKILSILVLPEYQYALSAYIKIFIDQGKTQLGENLMNLLDLAAPKGMQFQFNSTDD